jgi:hypothetical protein
MMLEHLDETLAHDAGRTQYSYREFVWHGFHCDFIPAKFLPE